MRPDERPDLSLWFAMERELAVSRPYHTVRPDILRKLMECEMRVSDGRIFVDNVVVSNHALARALNIERMVIRWTVHQIGKSR